MKLKEHSKIFTEETKNEHKIMLVLFLVPLAANVTGLVTNGWTYTDGSQGLWKYCNTTYGYKCCAELSDHANAIGTTLPEFIKAVRAFCIIGVLFGFAGLLIFCMVTLQRTDERKNLVIVSFVCFLAAVICLLIAVAVYGGEFKNHELTRDSDLCYSFYITIISLLFYVLFLFPMYYCFLYE